MSKTVTDSEIRDTNTHQFEQDSGVTHDKQLYHFVNDLDAEVTITVYGTRQEDSDSFNDGEQLNSTTISADSTDYDTLTDPWEEVQFEVVASTVPTDGSLQIYEMS